jgi:hypothetical protein
MSQILARLDRLERALHLDEPEDNHALERLMAEMDLTAARLRASPDWRDPTPAELAEAERNFDEFMRSLP